MGWFLRGLLRWAASLALSALAAWILARIKGALGGRGREVPPASSG